MADGAKQKVYVIYSYTPEHPYYLDKTDVTEIKSRGVLSESFETEVKQLIADKKYCSPLKVDIKGVFLNRHDLVNYLQNNQMGYLI